MPEVAYLAHKIEGNHISRLSDDSVRREDKLVVRANCDLHGCSQDSRAVSESGDENAGVHHDEGVGFGIDIIERLLGSIKWMLINNKINEE